MSRGGQGGRNLSTGQDDGFSTQEVSTLDPRDARIAKLEELLEAALEHMAHLEEENRQLREENRQFKERLNLNESRLRYPVLP